MANISDLWSKFRCSPDLSCVLKLSSSWFCRVGPLPDPEATSQPEPSLREAETPPQENQRGAEVSAGDPSRSLAGGASPVELVLIVAPEPLPGQHHQQHRKALQLEGAISISGTLEEKEDHDEDTGGGSPPPWAQMSEPRQTGTVDLPTFTSQRPADLPAMTPAPSDHR